MRAPIARLLLALALGAASLPALAATPKVVATIKPIHALVAMVMGTLGTPELLVEGAASPHTYSLKPSDAGELQRAEVVFWSGPGMELFLEDTLQTLAPNAVAVALSETPGLTLLPVREGGGFEPHVHGDGHDHDEHEHEHEHEHDEHGAVDMHYWLDPDNAAKLLPEIAEVLSGLDPSHAAIYAENAALAVERLAALKAELQAELQPVQARPFIVFHDAYQYFENRFGVSAVGSVTVSPEVSPGAKRIAELRDKVTASSAACVFAEPQFEPAIITAITQGTSARTGVLDPEGAALEPGAELYPALLRGLAAALVDCLTP